MKCANGAGFDLCLFIGWSRCQARALLGVPALYRYDAQVRKIFCPRSCANCAIKLPLRRVTARKVSGATGDATLACFGANPQRF